MRNIVINSPSTCANGATWLANCLVEIGLPYLYPGKQVGELWDVDAESGVWQIKEEFKSIGRQIPALSVGRVHCFKSPELSFTLEHQMLTHEYACKKAILFIRDPRDALFSMWKRYEDRWSFKEFLSMLVYSGLPNLHYCNLIYLQWLRHQDCLIVSFEDYKNDARGTLRRVLDFIDVDRTDSEISVALERSSVDAARANEENYKKTNKDDGSTLIGPSTVGRYVEYRERYSDEFSFIERECGSVMKLLGYVDVSQSYFNITLDEYYPVLLLNSELRWMVDAGPLRHNIKPTLSAKLFARYLRGRRYATNLQRIFFARDVSGSMAWYRIPGYTAKRQCIKLQKEIVAIQLKYAWLMVRLVGIKLRLWS